MLDQMQQNKAIKVFCIVSSSRDKKPSYIPLFL